MMDACTCTTFISLVSSTALALDLVWIDNGTGGPTHSTHTAIATYTLPANATVIFIWILKWMLCMLLLLLLRMMVRIVRHVLIAHDSNANANANAHANSIHSTTIIITITITIPAAVAITSIITATAAVK